MTVDFIERKRAEARQQRESAMTEYRVLIQKYATSKMTGADEKRLEIIAEKLGRNLETIEADREVFKQHEAIAAGAATLPADIKAQQEVKQKAKEFDTEYNAAHEEWKARWKQMQALCQAADKKVGDAAAAKEKLAEHRKKHWRLFGDPDPEVEARKFHLAQVLYSGVPKDATRHVVEFEQVMAGPEGHRQLADPTADELLVPLPGQTPEEAAALLAEARRLIAANRPGRYLLPADDEARACTNRGLIIPANALQHLLDPGWFNFSEQKFVYTFTPAPGQSQDQLDELVAQLRRALTKYVRQEIQAGRLHIEGGLRILEGASK